MNDKWGSTVSTAFQVAKGVRQGGILSSMYLEEFPRNSYANQYIILLRD